MPTVDEYLLLAKSHHRNSRLAEAVDGYRQVLALEPRHLEAQYLLGAALHSLGRRAEAIAPLTQAITLNPNFAEGHHRLGIVLAESGRLEEAVACFRRTVELKPELADAQHDLAIALANSGRMPEAAIALRAKLALRPNDAAAHNDLGCVLERLGEMAEAVTQFRLAVDVEPRNAPYLTNLAGALRTVGQFDEALQRARQAIVIEPRWADAHYQLGAGLTALDREAEAERSLLEALALNPQHQDAHNDLGILYARQGRLTEAIASCRRAVTLRPDDANAHSNLATALHEQGQLDEAIECFRRALALAPVNADVHFNYGLALLLAGRLTEGWPEFEWRLRRPGKAGPQYQQPRWTGDSLVGRTILLHWEQGLGDTLQFIRYVEILAQQAARVIVKVQSPLVPLLRHSTFANMLAEGDATDDFDCYASLMSLPALMRTTLATVPRQVPYLTAPPTLVDEWRATLAGNRFRVGLAWQGSRAHQGDRFRSIALGEFAPLALHNVELISLQKGDGSEQLAALGGQFAVRNLGVDFDTRHGAFVDTAAVMRNLDLVVTSDSAIAHLAGALGVPVWVALCHAPDWRWMLDRADTPWYPTMRLFRQQTLGRWDTVFAEMRAALSELVQRRSAT